MVIDAVKKQLCAFEVSVFSHRKAIFVLISHYFELQIIKFNTLMNINGIQAIYI